MLTLEFPDLPIQASLPEVYNHLLESPNHILVAPPGTGKTTLVPLSLQKAPWRNNRKIIMLEPRRVATRAAAKQMSSLLHEQTGQTVGYRTRLEKAVSQRTIIEVVTQGLFLRRLLNDPFLDQIACIIFDEIHERSLEADLCLALCRNLQKNLRSDLRLLAMSATPELDSLQKILECDITENKDTRFPVTIHHRKRDILTLKELPKTTALEIHSAYQQETGNLLAFLPGMAEIQQTMSMLSLPEAEILPLYGDLPSHEQDKALRAISQSDKRRVILATSIAETSLTVPGVRVVIDGGFRKTPQFNGDTGLTRLVTKRISKATAEQRTGRAGRETDGTVYRLWTKAMEHSLPLHDRPEILTSELSEFLLICQAWTEITGVPFRELVFPDPPSNGLLEAANSLLELLGASNAQKTITDFGKKIIQFGSHPRLAAMMLRANTNAEKALAADMAALLEERDPLRFTEAQSVDIQSRLDWISHPPASAHAKGLWYRIHQISHDYKKRLQITPTQKAAGDPGHFLCAAFPDRLAQQRNKTGSFRFAGGGGGTLSQQDPFATQTMLAVANVHNGKQTTINLAAPVSLSSLPDFITKLAHYTKETELDPVSGKIIVRNRMQFGKMTLQDTNTPATAQQAYPILLSYIKNNFCQALNWDEPAKALQARCIWARDHLKEEKIPDISSKSLILALETWLPPWLMQINNLETLRKLNVRKMLEAYLGYSLCQKLDLLFPAFIMLNRHKIMIDYNQPVPAISAQAQKFYGLKETPTIAKGKIPLQCCILSPANRPQAITSNLARFWKEGWKDMRKAMKGRYPKHDWPENPCEYTK